MTKGNGAGSLEDLSERAFEIAKRRQVEATEVVEMLEEQFETAFESHAGTLLRAAAWLAGTSLYRSFGLPADVPPGSPVLSDQANEELPKLLKIFMTLINKDGVHALVFPCRRVVGAWINAETKAVLELRPTHWRTWVSKWSRLP